MADDSAKLWFQSASNQAATNQAMQVIESIGRALPCKVTAVDGAIVTVTFEVAPLPWTLPPVMLPKIESPYFRVPTQVGDYGVTFPADTWLGVIAGLGGGTADLTVDYGNMATLAFMPMGSTAFDAMVDPDKAQMQGPNGFVLQDPTSAVQIIGDVDAGTITLTAGGKSWTFGASGFTDDAGVIMETHVHGGVTAGGAMTGPPEA
jgi:GpV Apex motif